MKNRKTARLTRILLCGPLLVLISLHGALLNAATDDRQAASNSSKNLRVASAQPEGQSKAQAEGPQESPLNFGLDIEFSPTSYPNYLYTPSFSTRGNGYEIHVGFEWFLFKTTGKLGLGLASGFFTYPNVGVTTDQNGTTQVATLYTIPISAYLSYRFDYQKKGKQIVVPFVKFGPNYSLIIQHSNFNSYVQLAKSGVGSYVGLEYGGGLELCLNFIEPATAADLDRSTGINATYLIVEYMRSSAISGASSGNDLSGYQIRMGLRFEI